MQGSELEQMQSFHWMMDMLQSVDVGIVVLDKNFRVQVWNGFMESHSFPVRCAIKPSLAFFPMLKRSGLLKSANPFSNSIRERS